MLSVWGFVLNLASGCKFNTTEANMIIIGVHISVIMGGVRFFHCGLSMTSISDRGRYAGVIRILMESCSCI